MSDEIEIPGSLPRGGDVSGRRVVITGAGRGLGRLLAHAFSQAGASVALVARTEADLKEVADELDGPSLVCSGDVTDDLFNDEVADATVAEWGGVDAWICNAGISPIVAGPLDTDPAIWRQVLDVNLTAAFLGARAAARVMEDGGRLIFTGSVLGERPGKGLSAYSASKAGLVGLAKGLALDLARQGITVNVVAPGWVPVERHAGVAEEAVAQYVAGVPVGRIGRPEDVAGAVSWLLSDAASFVTGERVTVNGGHTIGSA
jgi:NAD(P)-dependent dehydrogenase (short-subunit alcohol dehydrogenase family)